jgi:hypothetical protein
MKYIDLLNQTAEETAKLNNELIAEEAGINLQSALFNVKRNLAEKVTLIAKLKQFKNLNFGAIVAATNEYELLLREQKQLQELQLELF